MNPGPHRPISGATEAAVEEAGVGGSGSALAARAATPAAPAGEPAAGRLGLEVITRLTAAGARAVGSAVAEGSGHREDAVVAATEEGQSSASLVLVQDGD